MKKVRIWKKDGDVEEDEGMYHTNLTVSNCETAEEMILAVKSFFIIVFGTVPEKERERKRLPRNPNGLTAKRRLSSLAKRTIN
jgi:hypothetical protein